MVLVKSDTEDYNEHDADGLLRFVSAHLTEMISGLSHQRVDEIGSTKSSGDQRGDRSTIGRLNLDIASNMREDIVIAK